VVGAPAGAAAEDVVVADAAAGDGDERSQD